MKEILKPLMVLIIMIVASVSPSMAQRVEHFRGRLTVRPESPYVMRDVAVDVSWDKSGNTALVTLHHVKFSRMMPVRLTIQVPQVKVTPIAGGFQLSGDNIVPLKGGSPYPQRMVRRLQGTVKGSKLSLHLTIGTAPIHYEGESRH